MSKTPFSKKCEIVGALWLFYREEARDNEDWSNFFDYNDIGLPMAYCIAQGLVTAVEDGEAEKIIDETWTMLCNYVGVQPEDEFDSLQEMFEASPQNKEQVSE
jgi:hypothetical protein